MAILNMTYGSSNDIKVPLDAISVIAVTGGDEEATITWTDPTDLTVNGVLVTSWSSTKIVRKVGSAPSNSSDGTLVLTETVRNDYSVTGYTDTGLTNGTTYYYAAFAVGDNGLETISSTIPDVTPDEQGWRPTADTLLYLPLESDFVDQSGQATTRVFSTNSLSYTTVGGVPSVHIGTTGGAKLTTPKPLQSDNTKPISASVLVYLSDTTTSQRRSIWDISYSTTKQVLAIDANDNRILMGVYNNNNDSYYSVLYAPITANTRMHIVYTITSSASKMYLNGQLVDSGNGNPIPRGLRPYSHDNTQGILTTRDNSYYKGLNGNARELILEQKERTADEVVNYYTWIKGKLGF